MTTRAFKIIQYGYHGKNCVFSDHTERNLSEMYSNVPVKFAIGYLLIFRFCPFRTFIGGWTFIRQKGSINFSTNLDNILTCSIITRADSGNWNLLWWFVMVTATAI